MKTLLNLKGLCRSSQLALNPDGQPTVNRRSRLMSIICLFLLTLGTGQMWASFTVPTGGKQVYFCTGEFTDWEKDSRKFAICVQSGGSGGTFAAMTAVEGTSHMFVGTIPAGTWDKIFFLRVQSEWTISDGWNKKDNQCERADYVADESHVVFVKANKSDDWNSGNGTWYGAYRGGESLFLKANSNWTTSNANFQAKFWTSSNAETTKTVRFTHVGKNDYSLTIPAGGWTNFKIQRMSTDWNTEWNYTKDISYSSSNNCVKLAASCSSSSDVTWGTMSTPEISINATAISTTQIQVDAYITNLGGVTTDAADMAEIGFYLGETKYSAYSTSESHFYKTFSGLSPNTTYSIKAFAKNAFATAETETSSVTTRSTGNYPIKVRVAHGAAAPKIYAWTDGSTYGGVKEQNAAYASRPSLTKTITGTTYDWYQYSMSNDYSTFSLDNGSDGYKVDNLSAPLEEKCYYYNYTGSGEVGTMDCPSLTTQLVIKKDGPVSDTRVDMAGSDPITLNYNLDANSIYKVKILYGAEYYGKNTSTLNRETATSSNTISGMVVEQEYITLNTDFAGTYSFSFDPDDKSLVVGYPSAHTVTYGVGTVAGCASVTPTPNFSNGALQLDATSITFAKSATISGYTWKGWYNNAAGTGDAISTTDGNYTSSSRAANYSIYACYTENNYTVSVVSSSATAGSVASSSVTGHVTTSVALPTATPNPGYYFVNWEVTIGTASITNENNASGATINGMTGDCTVRANFAPIWALTGNTAELGNWSSTANEIENITTAGDPAKTSGYVEVTLYPNRDYNFRIRDNQHDDGYNTYRYSVSGNMSYTSCTDWQLYANQGTNSNIKTAGYGTYRFTWNITDKQLTVTYPASSVLTLDWGYAQIDNLAIVNSGNTGGSVTARTNEGGGDGFAITNSQYFANGSNITFTAAPATGYTVEWYNNSDYAENHKITTGGNYSIVGNTLTVSSITADLAVYAKFVENATTVTIAANDESRGSVRIGGAAHTWGNTTTAGVTTGRALSVTANTGYYFAGWTKTEGTDYKLGSDAASDYEEDSKTPTLKGKGAGETSGQILTARFEPLEKVYFRNWNEDSNAALWSNVYVYFSTSTEGWSGSGMCAKTNSSADYKAEMSREGTSNIYWAYVPRGTTRNGDVNIAFSNTSFGTNYKFNSGEAVMRGDYKSYYNTFVPQHSDTETKNGTKYYKGYWKNHNKNNGDDAGYYLKRFNGSSYEDAKGDHKFTIGDDNTIICNLRIDNTTSGYNKYMVAGAAGDVKYITSPAVSYVGPQITSSNFTDVPMQEWNDGSPYFEIIPTSEGNYVLSIDQSGDKMKVSVNYPVSIGDYRLRHSYGTPSTYTYSDIIKAGTEEQTMSMYINTKAASLALSLGQCTAVVEGVPQWEEVKAIGVDKTEGNFDDGSGVYQFTLNNPGSSATLSDIAPYSGQYYIKTDGASGGWANYKQNSMEENTLNYDAKAPEKSFNYYYCKYYDGAGANLKCVIANDYCEALTDTLVGDEVLGLVDAKPRQTTPSAASVRFSYNSYTNEIKRSYLGSSVNDDFLRILGNTAASAKHIYDKAETTFDDEHADAYIKFEDKQNWRYEIDVKADVNARAKLTASFNGQTQYFMGQAGETGQEWDDANTEQLFGGTSGTYGLTLVYDFKTNNLIRAWKPTGDAINSDLSIKSDILLLREHQAAPTAITFGKKDGTNYASLTDVKTVYSVLRFNRWKLSNRANPTDLSSEHCKTADLITTYHPALNSGDAGYLPQAERELYFISFPYDVKMSDIIHFGGYYDTWGIMYYDGKGRAKNGYWIDSESNWKYFTPEEFATKELKAYEGYLIGIDLAAMAYNNTSFWTNNSCEVNIYFPSKEPVSTITQKEVTVSIDTVGYQCKINRTYGGNDGDRRIKDSHWHCIGVPAYADLSHAITNSTPTDPGWTNKSLLYLYEWNPVSNDHSIKDASTFNFQAMYAYLVQYANDEISWSAAAATGPTPVAAKRTNTGMLRDRKFNLQLWQGGKEADHTYIRLSDDEKVTTGFEFNYDVSKMMLNGANIYTLIGKEQAAANSLPLNMEQTTVVPIGVKIAAEGEYTFSMPEGTEGIGATLIDNETGIRTNLALTDYTVTLTAGEINNRFTLEISPIAQTPTGIGNVQGNDVQGTKAQKRIIDGILYIVKDGQVFDARGNKVK